jgi:hypothetical protein
MKKPFRPPPLFFQEHIARSFEATDKTQILLPLRGVERFGLFGFLERGEGRGREREGKEGEGSLVPLTAERISLPALDASAGVVLARNGLISSLRSCFACGRCEGG